MAKSKPLFRVGQIVVVKVSSFKYPFRITGYKWDVDQIDETGMWWYKGETANFPETHLRPLTEREIGPARRRSGKK